MMKRIIYSIWFSALLSLNLAAQCPENTHSSFTGQSWLSCQTSVNQNVDRGELHWLSMDLSYAYILDTLTIWNFNEWGKTGNGVKELIIDYSVDGLNWNSVGPFQLNKAPGSWKYKSPSELALGNITARYLIFSAMSTWDEMATCAGISEIKIGVEIPSSTEDPLSSLALKISPNPASSFIDIELGDMIEECKFQIINSLGQVVKEKIENNFNSTTFDIHDLSDGSYFLRISDGKSQMTQTFIKMTP